MKLRLSAIILLSFSIAITSGTAVSVAHAQQAATQPATCAGTSPGPDYTCKIEPSTGLPAWEQNCTIDPQTGNCEVEEVVVTASKPKTASGPNLAGIVSIIVAIVNGYVIPLLYALAFVYFLVGLVRFLFVSSSEEDQEAGKKMMLYGTIGLVVLFGVWGIVNVALSTIGAAVGST